MILPTWLLSDASLHFLAKYLGILTNQRGLDALLKSKGTGAIAGIGDELAPDDPVAAPAVVPEALAIYFPKYHLI